MSDDRNFNSSSRGTTGSSRTSRRACRRIGGAIATAAFALVPAPVSAQKLSADDIHALRAEIEALRAEQRKSDARISELEAMLAARPPRPAAPIRTVPEAQAANQAAPQALAGVAGPAPTESLSPAPRRLQLNGDFRLRYESNFGIRDTRDRSRGALRARLRAAYAFNDWLTLGGQIATGDPDDPNSTDVTLSNFDDDLQVSLDQAYAKASFGGLVVTGGKIPQPFLRTELVWDGDVSPQGISASYRIPLGGDGAGLKLTSLYFLVDEAVAGPDSAMVGVQVGLETPSDRPWRLELAGAYYDYALRSVAGADGGDLRTNLIGPDGRYLSDFDLLNGVAVLSYSGFGPRWPVKVVADFVRNLGAATDAQTGFGVDLTLGRGGKRGDWRFGYGYAEADADAVLAAFSQDNTNLATNYLQHMLFAEHVLRNNLILNGTFYRYRRKDALYPGSTATDDWLNRLRLNLLMVF